jgi:hypothetical protein
VSGGEGGVRRRKRRAVGISTIGVRAISRALGWTGSEVTARLATLTPVPRRGEARFLWCDVWSALVGQLPDHLVERLREARLRTRTSKRWIAGHPGLVREWHRSRNVDLFPDCVSYGSHRRVWWRCERVRDHEWCSIAQGRVRGDGCPFCAGKKVASTNCLATLRPDVAAQWHPARNGALTPRDVLWSAAAKAWWRCEEGRDHEWIARVNSRTSSESGCPFCARRAVSETNTLAVTSPAVAREWHPSRNGALSPRDVTSGSSRHVWWRCSAAAAHEWQATVNSRVSHRRGCPFCARKRTLAADTLARRRPSVAREWHPTRNGAVTPRDVAHDSSRPSWWQCRKRPEHVWRAAIKSRALGRSLCPHCRRGAREKLRRGNEANAKSRRNQRP